MRLVAVFLVAALSSGCGAHGGHGEVRIALVANSYTHLPVMLAASLGFYQQEGIAVRVEPLPSAQKTAEALLAGSAELATGGYDQLLQLVAGGRQVQSVVVNTNRDARAIYASPVRKHILAMRDLKGRNFGVPGLGSANHLFALHVFALHGLRAGDVSFSGVGVGASMIAALERGVIDAAVVTGVDAVRLRKRNPAIIVLAEAISPEGSNAVWKAESMPAAIVFAEESWIAANRDKVMRIVRADCRALAWIRSHSIEELLAVLPEAYRMEDRETDLAGLRMMKPIYSPDGLMPRAGAEAIRAALASTGETVRQAGIDVSRTYTDEFARDGHNRPLGAGSPASRP